MATKAAAAYIDKYFQRYPGVKQYMDETRAAARSMGYVETVFGRRLYLPEINGGNGPRKKAAERQAINAPMQGTAAEVFGVALDQVSSEQRRYAKVINFGLIYGMSSFGLAKNLGIETKAAAAYIDRYFQRYPGVKQ